MRTLVRILADLRAAQAELKRLEEAVEGTPEAAERARVEARLAALQAEWEAANRARPA
jgi:hypothetical protein